MIEGQAIGSRSMQKPATRDSKRGPSEDRRPEDLATAGGLVARARLLQ
jgi:hypothetical protein